MKTLVIDDIGNTFEMINKTNLIYLKMVTFFPVNILYHKYRESYSSYHHKCILNQFKMQNKFEFLKQCL